MKIEGKATKKHNCLGSTGLQTGITE